MTIESEIQRVIDVLEDISGKLDVVVDGKMFVARADAYESLANESPLKTATENAKEGAKKKRGRPKKTETQKYTEDDVRQAADKYIECGAVAKEVAFAKCQEIVNSYGATHINKLDPEKYGTVILAFEEEVKKCQTTTVL